MKLSDAESVRSWQTTQDGTFVVKPWTVRMHRQQRREEIGLQMKVLAEQKKNAEQAASES